MHRLDGMPVLVSAVTNKHGPYFPAAVLENILRTAVEKTMVMADNVQGPSESCTNSHMLK